MSVPAVRGGHVIKVGLRKPSGKSGARVPASGERFSDIVTALVEDLRGVDNSNVEVAEKVPLRGVDAREARKIRNYLVHQVGEVPDVRGRVGLIDTDHGYLIEVTMRQAVSADSRREMASIQIPTATGPFEYEPPIDLATETISAQEASARLSKSGSGVSRTVAHEKRKQSKLLAVRVANGFRFPTFQFDPRGGIRPLVADVNERLGALSDPWGTLSWWFDENEILGDARPADLVVSADLDEESLDAAVADLTAGM